MMVLAVKKIVFSVALLAMSISLSAQQKQPTQEKQQPNTQEHALVQRLYETQQNGSDSDFYEAHEAFMKYLENRLDWDKYYRTWMNRVIYEVNNRRFHRAFIEIHRLTDDIKERNLMQYLYLSNMGMGFFYNGRFQPEMSEKFFRRALEDINVKNDSVALFNLYRSLGLSRQPATADAAEPDVR